MKQTVLIIEDEDRIAHWVKVYFEKAGFETQLATDGLTGLDMARTQSPDLLILDLMLPGMDGIEVCQTLRAESDVPIIMLTARSKSPDRVLGLDLGADDYISKPFDPEELVARARAVLRRTAKRAESAERLCLSNICLNLSDYSCQVGQQSVELSRIQFALLEVLMRRAGHPLSREQLLDAAFTDNYDVTDRTIDVHIRRLRRKIETDPANPAHIVTVFGRGYKFVE